MTRYLPCLGLLTLSLFNVPLEAMIEEGEPSKTAAPKPAVQSSSSTSATSSLEEDVATSADEIIKLWGEDEEVASFKKDIQKILRPLPQEHRPTFVACVKTLIEDPNFFPNKTLERACPMWWGVGRILKALASQPSSVQSEFSRYSLLVNTLINAVEKASGDDAVNGGYINSTGTIEAMSKLPPERFEWFHKTLGHFLEGAFRSSPDYIDYTPLIDNISGILAHLPEDQAESFVSQADSLMGPYRGKIPSLFTRSEILTTLNWTPPSEREDAVLRVRHILEEDYGLVSKLPSDHEFTSPQLGSISYLRGMVYVLGNTPRDQRDDVTPLLRRVIKKESSGALFSYIHCRPYDRIMEGLRKADLRKADTGRVPPEDDDNSATGSYEESEDS